MERLLWHISTRSRHGGVTGQLACPVPPRFPRPSPSPFRFFISSSALAQVCFWLQQPSSCKLSPCLFRWAPQSQSFLEFCCACRKEQDGDGDDDENVLAGERWKIRRPFREVSAISHNPNPHLRTSHSPPAPVNCSFIHSNFSIGFTHEGARLCPRRWQVGAT